MEIRYYEFQSKFYRIGRNPAVLYMPVDDTENRHIGIVTMHSDADYLDYYPGSELARRGFTSLCCTPYMGLLEEKMVGVRECVDFLRALDGIDTVVILGHSGGATLMSAYQDSAENGIETIRTADRIYKGKNVGELTPADGVMLIDSNWGNGMMTLLSLYPGVRNEFDPSDLDMSYNLFDEVNGFSKDGVTIYQDEFITRFQQAQGERMNNMINYATERLRAIENGEGKFEDDEPLLFPVTIGGANNNLLFPQDTRLLSHTVGEWPLVHADGSETIQKVYSVRLPKKNVPSFRSFRTSIKTTVRTFLSNNIVKTNNFSYDASGMCGVEWRASFCNTPGNVMGIHSPILILGMTGSHECIAAETIYNNCPSTDKTLGYIEGASHMLATNKDAESYPGQYGDTVKTLFDCVAKWLLVPNRFASGK